VCGFEEMAIDLRAMTATIGTTVLKEGDWLTIDGTTGNVVVGTSDRLTGDRFSRDCSVRSVALSYLRVLASRRKLRARESLSQALSRNGIRCAVVGSTVGAIQGASLPVRRRYSNCLPS